MTLQIKFTALIFWWSISTVLGQTKIQNAVLDAELQRFNAMVHMDTTRLSPMLSADLIYVHSNALVESKTDHLQAIASQKLIYLSMNREKASVRLYGKTALVNGTVAVKGVLNGNDFAIRLLYSAIYRRKQGDWLLLNWQSTRIP
ncbi:MAG: nuclear transport factor 2 family protein [Saprospiraceae bacterium]|nr:nuclear transport factor 2 family protein [Saprospiraceae bacterium]